MSDLRVRGMAPAEFEAYRARSVSAYAAAHVRAGDWTPEQAEDLAAQETGALLPDGVDTPGVALLVGEHAGEAIGMVWVGPAPRLRPGWWIYDIEVVPDQRGHGYGRGLLEAAEQEVTRRGGDVLGLNVFGGNDPAEPTRSRLATRSPPRRCANGSPSGLSHGTL